MSTLEIRLHNTLSGEMEPFTSIEPGHVRMYHCGPTVYGYPHIGNLSAFMLADLLRRSFEYAGYRVTQVMNITDVGHLTHDDVADAEGEDKLERAARALKRTPWDLARHYTQSFFQDIEALNIRAAHYYPRATEFIPEMIALIERLLERGLAYRAAGNVYFDVGRFEGYGKLSGNTPERLEAGARVEVRGDKRGPHDFALWKSDPEHIMQWDAPFGRGFPGWHIECSAMSMRFLGDSFDIHTGGADNIFPHHECEIAQSEGATGEPFARFWLHTAFMQVEGQKMSKSLGNIYTLRDILERGYSAREVRYTLLKTHYRTPANFSFESVEASRAALKRIDAFVYRLGQAAGEAAAEGTSDLARRARAGFEQAIAADLNLSQALAAVFELVAEGNRRDLAPGEAADLLRLLRAMDGVLGVLFWEPLGAPAAQAAAERRAGPTDEEVAALVQRRQEARAARDFAEADRIRDALRAQGVVIEDRPEGPRVIREA